MHGLYKNMLKVVHLLTLIQGITNRYTVVLARPIFRALIRSKDIQITKKMRDFSRGHLVVCKYNIKMKQNILVYFVKHNYLIFY
jgi:hypothetical protein